MEGEYETILSGLEELWSMLWLNLRLLWLPNQLGQLATILSCVALAWLLDRQIGPKFEDWIRSLEGRPKWQLRWLIVLRNRMALAYFATLCWLASGAFSLIYTFPSRRYLLTLAATIATAWLFIRIAAQVVRNRSLRRLTVWGLTIYATIYYLGLVDEAAILLDDISIEFGDFKLSVLAILKAAIVTALLVIAARTASHTAARRIGANEDISPSMRVLTVKFLQITLYSAAFFIGLKAVGFDLTGLAVLSGAIGLGLGFGLQKVVSNLVSGVIILLDKSIKPGDVISLGDTFGWIEELGARYVSVVTRDGKEYLIPNEDLITGQVVNWSHTNQFVRIDLFFGTAYGDDPHLVRKIAIEAAHSVKRVLSSRPAVCHITGFGDSSVDYILRFWISDPVEGLTNVRGNVYLALWDAFKKHGISIPFPQREVTVLKGSELRTETIRPRPDTGS
ncbi:mechanosensitive ion channel [Defluviimonas sp. WL0024]|uniref:Mechanosensitive ion channel n=2 Tax=Albidovulum TaxID=205889 RepID=A0ABT3IZ17_9RHOB|nr:MULTISPECIES: mechanosensitive ion channel domain-containing protein [Defluviimonas]MCU9848346.1 mechanosensitive ion channel [Defluviimonas sp. WL0024]MCW3780668.1 mechanosensitive ion channel [Defluviimonas salinarum]